MFYRAWLAGEEERLGFWCSTVPPLPKIVASASNVGIVGRALAMQAVERWCSCWYLLCLQQKRTELRAGSRTKRRRRMTTREQERSRLVKQRRQPKTHLCHFRWLPPPPAEPRCLRIAGALILYWIMLCSFQKTEKRSREPWCCFGTGKWRRDCSEITDSTRLDIAGTLNSRADVRSVSSKNLMQ